jgi:hypothetical protein
MSDTFRVCRKTRDPGCCRAFCGNSGCPASHYQPVMKHPGSQKRDVLCRYPTSGLAAPAVATRPKTQRSSPDRGAARYQPRLQGLGMQQKTSEPCNGGPRNCHKLIGRFCGGLLRADIDNQRRRRGMLIAVIKEQKVSSVGATYSCCHIKSGYVAPTELHNS